MRTKKPPLGMISDGSYALLSRGVGETAIGTNVDRDRLRFGALLYRLSLLACAVIRCRLRFLTDRRQLRCGKSSDRDCSTFGLAGTVATRFDAVRVLGATPAGCTRFPVASRHPSDRAPVGITPAGAFNG